MSPTLAMIAERDANISVFKPEPFYTVHLTNNGFSLIGEKIKNKPQAQNLQKACDGAKKKKTHRLKVQKRSDDDEIYSRGKQFDECLQRRHAWR